MQFQLKAKTNVLFLVFFFFLSSSSFFLTFWLSFDKWMALEWFGLETWIKEDTLMRKKEWQREGGLEPSQYWTSIHLFHTFLLALVLCRFMRLEPFLGHRQENPLDRWPVHHTHSIFTLTQSPVHLHVCLWIVGEPRGNQHQHRENIQTQHSKVLWDSNTAHTVPHYTRLMVFFVVVVIIASDFYYYYIYCS